MTQDAGAAGSKHSDHFHPPGQALLLSWSLIWGNPKLCAHISRPKPMMVAPVASIKLCACMNLQKVSCNRFHKCNSIRMEMNLVECIEIIHMHAQMLQHTSCPSI